MPHTGWSGTSWYADGGEGVGGLFTMTPGLLLAAVIAVLVLAVALILTGWLAWRRVRRSGRLDQGMSQLRAAALPPGPRREIAALRVRLHDHMAQTQRVVATAPDGPARELLGQLRPAAGELDARLRLLESEPDQAYLAQILPMVREPVERLCTNASTLRQTALDLGQNDLGHAVLEQDLCDQITALQAGAREIRALEAGRGGPDDPAAEPMGPTENLSPPPRRPDPTRPGDIEHNGPQR